MIYLKFLLWSRNWTCTVFLDHLDALDRDIVPHPFSNWGKGVYLLNLIKICYEVLRKWGWMESLMENKIIIHSKDRDLENLCSHQWGPLSLDKIEHHVYKLFFLPHRYMKLYINGVLPFLIK